MPRTEMRVGFALPQYDGYSVPAESPLAWSSVERWATAAVDHGFTSLWVSDHLFLDIEKYGGPPGHHFCLDPVVTMGALAGLPAVQHARTTIGCLVFAAPFRPPRLLAKQLHTLGALAPGRVVAGLGAGWYEPEFAELGIPFDRPGARFRFLVETIEEVRGFFAGEADPERHPPLWVGGRGDRLLRDVVAPHADGWNTVWCWPTDAYRAKLDVLHRACEDVGRDPSSVTLSLGLTTLVGEDEADVRRRYDRLVERTPAGVLDSGGFDAWRAGRLVGTVEQVREQVEGWRALGVALLVVNLGALPFSVTDTDDLDLVASAIS